MEPIPDPNDNDMSSLSAAHGAQNLHNLHPACGRSGLTRQSGQDVKRARTSF